MTRYRLAISLAIAVVVLTIVAIIIAPLVTTTAVKIWIQRAAEEQGLSVSIGEIEAPLLRPVVLRSLQIRAQTGNSVALQITRVEADLRLASVFGASPKRLLRSLTVDELRGEIDLRRASDLRANRGDWSVGQRLLADRFAITSPHLLIRSDNFEKRLCDFSLNASDLDPGSFRAAEIAITTPWFAKTFAELRGATLWQENRLTLGAISLMRGLDIDVLTFDFAHLAEQHVAIELALDMFGGKFRAGISADNRGNERTWDIAGNAVDVSIARVSDALEFSTRASGSLHACKFTFRGNSTDLANATASIWTEVSGLTWRDRTAETVMLGASLYNRQIQVQQLYIKQRRNELTLSGESALPRKLGELPDFRGDVSAAVADLSDFARLLGWNPADFAGEVAINGSVTEHQRKLAGDLAVSGNSLKIFAALLDSLDARIALSGTQVELRHCELRRLNPPELITCRGTVDFSNTDNMVAELDFERPLQTIGEIPSCLDGMQLADGSLAASGVTRFSAMRFQGPLFRNGWTAQLVTETSDLTVPFCENNADNGGTLTIAPLPAE